MTNPKLVICPSKFDKILDFLSVLLLITLWGGAVYVVNKLPEIIPTHYNLLGFPNNHGSKYLLYLLPILGTLIYFGLTLLNQYPHNFNYPINITTDNAERQYSLATRLIRTLKFTILLILISLVYETNKVIDCNNCQTLPIIILISPIIIAIILYLIQAKKTV
jgi:hypothetical protein